MQTLGKLIDKYSLKFMKMNTM